MKQQTNFLGYAFRPQEIIDALELGREEKPMKIVQIATTVAGDDHNLVVILALCEDGTLWVKVPGESWKEIKGPKAEENP